MNRLVGNYLKKISSVPLISLAEEKELARRARKGDIEARNRLIISNLRYVVSLAKHYTGRGLSLQELINEGSVGLIEAVKRFDERKNTRLISYAHWWIRYCIVTALAKRKLIKLPLDVWLIAKRIKDSYSKITSLYGREPTVEELAKELKIRPTDIGRAFLGNITELSLDGNRRLPEETFFAEIPSQTTLEEDVARKKIIKEEVQELLNYLDSKEKKVVVSYFGLDDEIPMTLQAIGKNLGLTREAIRQIKKRALKKIRAKLKTQKLKALFGI